MLQRSPAARVGAPTVMPADDPFHGGRTVPIDLALAAPDDPRTRALREVADLARDLRQRFVRHVLHHWHHEAVETKVDSNADVDTRMNDQIVAVEGQLTVVHGDTVHELNPGDCLRYRTPKDTTIRNASHGRCRYIVAVLRSSKT